jgi:putative transposase
MTHQNNYNLSAGTIEEITRNGLDAVPELMRVLLNNIMQVERAEYLRAGEYERTEDRKGYANGYKPKTVRRSPLPCHKYAKAAFTHRRWKKD